MDFTNRLISESSPYLLQHARNPVDWYPWGEEASQKAREENKPLLLSIGYAACHWCHVMERESFENPEVAAFMNEHFVNVKIDREERPDLDHIYMDAVQAMTGSGGWPLHVFLTPEGKPFYGGTYFPPKKAFNRPSWQEVLVGVSTAFREKRHEIDAQAENLTAHLVQSNSFGLQQSPGEDLFTETALQEIARNALHNADKQWGGFGKAPKFPQSFTIRFLLQYYHRTGEEEALKQALLSLDRMLYGGIYDQAGGGFARYATDTEWLVPHFEKMLYDNALLVALYSEAFQLTGQERYRWVIEETMAFVQRELLHPEKGFFAALDADSEGVEGRFYVWAYDEVQALLGEDAALFCAYYDIKPEGNWEHSNILWVKEDLETFAARHAVDLPRLQALLHKGKGLLLQKRAERVRPLLDDKVILGWNALMNSACSKAYAATGHTAYRDLALDNMRFLLREFREDTTGGLRHTWKNGQARFPGFLDDHAFLIRALLDLQEITGDSKWLEEAEALTVQVMELFADPDTPFFFYTPTHQQDVIVRKKEVYDGALPSGNAVMAGNCLHLGILLDRKEWKERAEAMLQRLGRAVIRYPTSFGAWACLLQEMQAGTVEIAVVGEQGAGLLEKLLRLYLPFRVIMLAEKPGSGYPLLAGKESAERPAIFVCRNYTCLRPVFSETELMLLINRGSES